MKGNNKKIIIGLLVVLLLGMVIFLLTKKEEEIELSTTVEEVEAISMNISNTLTSSGEISAEIATLSLSTSKTFSKLLVSTNSYVKKGTKMVKYSNGTYLKAPYNLVVISTSLPDSGSKARDSHGIEVYKFDTLKMNLAIDEEDLAKVAINQEAIITVNAYDSKEYTGKISKINQIGNYNSSGSTFDAIVTFSNDGNIKIGMSASVSIIVEAKENVIAVPIEAIQTKGNTKYVVLVNGGITSEVEVKTGISNDAYVEITEGLNVGDKIQIIKTNSSSNGSMSDRNNPFENINMPSDMPKRGNSENRRPIN